MKRLSEAQLAEVAQLRDRALFTLEIVQEEGGGPTWAQFRQAVLEAASKSNIRTLRAIVRELQGVLGAVSASARHKLECGLLVRFGIDASAERQKEAAAVARIRARGRIRSEREYRIVQGYADAQAGILSQDEYLALGALLDDFSAAQ